MWLVAYQVFLEFQHILICGFEFLCYGAQEVAGLHKVSHLLVLEFVKHVWFTKAPKLGVLLLPNWLYSSVTAAPKPVFTYILVTQFSPMPSKLLSYQYPTPP